jgi:sulfatase modifying factor 1
MRTLHVSLVVSFALVGCGSHAKAPPAPVPASAPIERVAPKPRCSAPLVLIPEGTAREFCLDATEVTVAEYARCVTAAACTPPNPYGTSERDRFRAFCNWEHPEARDQHPVNCLTYTQAGQYCAWRGARLPTDNEFAAAAGNGGRTHYPWGNDAPDATRTNGCGDECPREVKRITGNGEFVAQYPGNDGAVGTAAVGSYVRGDDQWGVHDLAGNVSEFVVPLMAAKAGGDLTAGGGCFTQEARFMDAHEPVRTAWSGAKSADLGFRCAADARVP